MQYLPTAFANVEFAWKLLAFGESGGIDLKKLDIEIVFADDSGRPFFVPPARIFDTEDDLHIALQNNLTIAFGAAAITLNRTREELGIELPNPITSEREQCIALIYQIRNAFAHDIAEPTWKINGRYRRIYEVGGERVDLTSLHDTTFEYSQIGGLDAFFRIKDFFAAKFLEH
jgi:hypothetical protein